MCRPLKMIIFKIFSLLLISFIIASCLYVPTEEHGYKYQKEVTKDMVKQLEPGTTTRDDVILLLGEPTYAGPGTYSDDEGEDFEKFFCYHWLRKVGYFITHGWHESIDVQHSFCLEFTLDGELKRFKHFESDGGYKAVYPQIEDWENEKD